MLNCQCTIISYVQTMHPLDKIGIMIQFDSCTRHLIFLPLIVAPRTVCGPLSVHRYK